MKQIAIESNNKANVQSVIGKDAIAIKSIIEASNVFQAEQGYPIILMDENLSRGLDPKTSTKIEDKGGIYVVIAKIPSTTKTLSQAIGRTKRCINKGQHSIIVWNKDKRAFDQILKDADEKSQFNMRQLLQLFKVLEFSANEVE